MVLLSLSVVKDRVADAYCMRWLRVEYRVPAVPELILVLSVRE